MFNCRSTQRKRLRESHWLQRLLISCSGLFILCIHDERWNHYNAMQAPMSFVGCMRMTKGWYNKPNAKSKPKPNSEANQHQQHCLFSLCHATPCPCHALPCLALTCHAMPYHALLSFSLSLSDPPGRSQCPTAVITDELKTVYEINLLRNPLPYKLARSEVSWDA